MKLGVILPTHNPDRDRLARTLAALAAQSLAAEDWELVVIDNASAPPLAATSLHIPRPKNIRVVLESEPGLTAARQRGLRETSADIVVFVDDDNVLAPNYLSDVLRIFGAYSRLGAIGGPSRPEFQTPPPGWTKEFFPLLALRDLGATSIVAGLRRSADGTHFEYPVHAPIGAGMALRRKAVEPWLADESARQLSDRRGSDLSSSGDNDIILSVLHAGWDVGYFPELELTHLIPATRLAPDYLARLNRGIQASWMRVLRRHDANPWSLLSPADARLRKLKAWFTYHGWSRPVGHIRWQGACGHFDGRVV